MTSDKVVGLENDYWKCIFQLLVSLAKSTGRQVVESPPGRENDEIFVLGEDGKSVLVLSRDFECLTYYDDTTGESGNKLYYGQFDEFFKVIKRHL